MLTDGLAYQREALNVESSSTQVEWEARLELELQIARDFGILTQISNYSDEFPNSDFSVFERNEKIRRELNLRERNLKIEVHQDEETWRRWGQRQAALVDHHNVLTLVQT